jgi:hypothetical protein
MIITRARWGRAGSVCLAASTLLIPACANATPDGPESSQPAGPTPSKSAGASALNGGEPHALTAAGVIDAITKAGMSAPNPLDTTAQDCPRIGLHAVDRHRYRGGQILRKHRPGRTVRSAARLVPSGNGRYFVRTRSHGGRTSPIPGSTTDARRLS